jgi:carbon monoxide dehydrogenase subunit G
VQQAIQHAQLTIVQGMVEVGKMHEFSGNFAYVRVVRPNFRQTFGKTGRGEGRGTGKDEHRHR